MCYLWWSSSIVPPRQPALADVKTKRPCSKLLCEQIKKHSWEALMGEAFMGSIHGLVGVRSTRCEHRGLLACSHRPQGHGKVTMRSGFSLSCLTDQDEWAPWCMGFQKRGHCVARRKDEKVLVDNVAAGTRCQMFLMGFLWTVTLMVG